MRTENRESALAANPYVLHWLYDQRMLWPGQFPLRKMYEVVSNAEEILLQSRNNPLRYSYAENMVGYLNAFMGQRIELKEISLYGQKYPVLMPHGNGVLAAIKQDPTTVAVFGDRKGGKTTTSWNLAWELYSSLKETKEGVEVHVYGDVDAITLSLKTYAKRQDADPKAGRFAGTVIEHPDYELPEITGRNQVIIYNEVGESTSSRRGMATKNLEISLRSYRVRHERRWMINNIIRPQSVDITLRESPIKIIHHSSLDNMSALEEMVKEPWRPFIWHTAGLSIGHALSIYSLMNYNDPGKMDKTYTTAVDLYDPHPPKWLLSVIETGKSMELQHADEIEFMKPRDERRKERGNIIKDQSFTFFKKKASEEFPRTDMENIYRYLMDRFGKGLKNSKALKKNHISYHTIKDLEDLGYIKYNDDDPANDGRDDNDID